MYTLKPILVVLSGAPVHGKDAVASCIASSSNALHFDVDAVRAEQSPESGGKHIEAMPAAYRALIERAAARVATGQPVIVTGTFSRNEFKEPLIQFIRGKKYPVSVFRLDVAGIETIRARLALRAEQGSLSPIRTDNDYLWALSLATGWPEDIPVVSVLTEEGVEATAQKILDQLQ